MDYHTITDSFRAITALLVPEVPGTPSISCHSDAIGGGGGCCNNLVCCSLFSQCRISIGVLCNEHSATQCGVSIVCHTRSTH